VKQKTSTSETTAETNTVAVISVGGQKEYATLASDLAEIRKLKGVWGYILRSDTSAIVDIAENTKFAQYALLAYQIDESGCTIANQFNLADVENVLVEGKKMKVLCIAIGCNRIGVFMDKTFSHIEIAEKLHS
jgi:predicted regulator of Ras-like GTPase activity (Roadblock/LC7/MglB family)